MLVIIDESAMPAARDAAIRALLCECFPPDAAVFSRTRHWHGSAPAYSVVFTREALVLGHVGIVIRTVGWGGEQIAIAGVQNVAVHPSTRGTGLGARLVHAAMNEAKQRHVEFGLLFCIPELERYYRSLGWETLHVRTLMRDEHGATVPTPAKNICMACAANRTDFPAGPIDLQGRDW